MTVFNLIPRAIKVIACASGAGSIVLMGRSSRSLPSRGLGMSSGLSSTVLPGAGSSAQLRAGISLLSSWRGWISETRRNNQRCDAFLSKLDKGFFISAQECKFYALGTWFLRWLSAGDHRVLCKYSGSRSPGKGMLRHRHQTWRN